MTDLWNEIVPGLWMGGTRDDEWTDVASRAVRGVERDERPFDAVVTLFALAQPLGWGVEELRFGFADGHPRYSDMAAVVRAAEWAHQSWSSGQRVLIRCQAGLNRSGVVTALVLMLEGWSPHEAIDLIRSRRSSLALCNDDFVQWLLAVDVQPTASAA